MVSSLKGSVRGGGGRLKEGGRDNSLWWRMIFVVRRGVGMGVGSWFEDNVLRIIGCGSTTFFWTDKWVGGVPLQVRFPRLFSLAENRWVTMAEMESRGWEDGGGAWEWRKRLLAWEEESVR